VHDGAGKVVDVKVLDDAPFGTQRRTLARGQSLVEGLFNRPDGACWAENGDRQVRVRPRPFLD
jgi:hypothetical protein